MTQRCDDLLNVVIRPFTHREHQLHPGIGLIGLWDYQKLSKETKAALRQEPWGFQKEAQTLMELSKAGPAVLILARNYSEQERTTLSKLPWPSPVWLADRQDHPAAPLEETKNFRAFRWSILTDPDRINRRVQLAYNKDGTWQPTLPLALLADYWRVESGQIHISPQSITVGTTHFPVDQKDQGLYYRFQGYPIAGVDWIEEGTEHTSDQLIPSPLQNLVTDYGKLLFKLAPRRYLFVGDYDTSAVGEIQTVHGKYRDFQLLAVCFDSLIKGFRFSWLTGGAYAGLYLLWSLVLIRMLFRVGSLRQLASTAIVLLSARIILTFSLCLLSISYVPLFSDISLLVVLTCLSAYNVWTRAIHMISYYGGSAAAKMATTGFSLASLESIDEREATILFVNLPEHLKVLERINSVELFGRRKEFSNLVTVEASRYGGIIHDYQADALMIGFGTNVESRDPKHATHAAQAALALHRRFAELHSHWLEATEPENLELYIGLCTGEVAVGFVGARNYKQAPAAVGDTTNVAARLMGSAKKQHVAILASKPTRLSCGDDIEVKELPAVQLKGKTSLVEIFQVTCIKGETV